VLLLERDVFKIKRPVDLGVLDFTTLDRREAACRAEVALNERLAPGTYLGVVPVARYEPVAELPSTEHLVLDTTRPIEESLGVLRTHLEVWPVGFVA
jgi:aminoglycoside phosphotransferase family enzyme